MAKQELIVGGGCFWCTEAVFELLKGVNDVESGYANGQTLNPTYRDICTGETGHAEVIKITYDDSIITSDTLLDIFFVVHNPTTLNQQGADRGTQYRSTILYTDEDTVPFHHTLHRRRDQRCSRGSTRSCTSRLF